MLAEQGNAWAQYNLGRMYYGGWGVRQDRPSGCGLDAQRSAVEAFTNGRDWASAKTFRRADP